MCLTISVTVYVTVKQDEIWKIIFDIVLFVRIAQPVPDATLVIFHHDTLYGLKSVIAGPNFFSFAMPPVCWVRLLLCWQPVVCTLYWHLLFIVYLLLLQLYSQWTKILHHIIFHCGLNERPDIHYVSQRVFFVTDLYLNHLLF